MNKPRIRFQASGLCRVVNHDAEEVPTYRRLDAALWCSLHNEKVVMGERHRARSGNVYPEGLNGNWPREFVPDLPRSMYFRCKLTASASSL